MATISKADDRDDKLVKPTISEKKMVTLKQNRLQTLNYFRFWAHSSYKWRHSNSDDVMHTLVVVFGADLLTLGEAHCNGLREHLMKKFFQPLHCEFNFWRSLLNQLFQVNLKQNTSASTQFEFELILSLMFIFNFFLTSVLLHSVHHTIKHTQLGRFRALYDT